jgi:hypothetical protein
VARVSFGLKAHSGWAALVALAEAGARLELIERRRLALMDADAGWQKHPYHAAEELAAEEAEELVRRATASAHAHAERALGAALAERRARGDEVVGCGVLLGAGMPDLSVAQIVAVHARMHQAEGELFRSALVRGAERAGLAVTGIREKELEAHAGRAIDLAPAERSARLAEAGKRAGPPWARDQKEAALAAWIALRAAGPAARGRG